jgi:3'-phosphoadenosine 5'-phosphosulfate sulfotransferase (PAPS reductase)/FAD synthetase
MLDKSREIVERAIAEHKPHAIISMVSGGKDSLCAALVAQELSVPVTHILHGRTGTGIAETTQFVREWAATQTSVYLEANAGDSYEQYVRRKGFFGRGVRAHSFAYHVLKEKHFRRTISQRIRQGKRGRTVLLLNGARVQESSNRAKNLSEPVRKDGSNVWVNICHHRSQQERDAYLDRVNAPVNPVTTKLCRLAECLCGSAQSPATREEVAFYYPEWGKWLDALERDVMAKFPWRWGADIPAWVQQEKHGQLPLFRPMCVSCVETDGVEVDDAHS